MSTAHQDPVELILSRLAGGGFDPRPTGKPMEWESRCPCHDGSRHNLNIGYGDDGRALLHCKHAPSCPVGDIVAAIALTTADLFPVRNGAAPTAKKKAKKPAKIFPSVEAALYALDSFPQVRELRRNGVWDYHSPVGRVVACVVRFDDGNGKKEYRPLREVDGGWSIGDPVGKWPLYRLPALAKASTIFVLEGEKSADIAAKLGVASTTTSHGADSPHKTDLGPVAGKDVVICPDADKAGETYAAKLAPLLHEVGAASVKIVRLPGLQNEGDDIEQWAELRRSEGRSDDEIRVELLRLAEQADAVEIIHDYDLVRRNEPKAGGRIAEVTSKVAKNSPYRLAAIYLERYAHPDHIRLAYHRGSFWEWIDSAWHERSEEEVSLNLSLCIEAEFQRLNSRKNLKNPYVTKRSIVADALAAVKSLTLKSSKIEFPSWLCEGMPPVSEFIATTNALIHLPSYVDGKLDAVRRPTPNFFAGYRLDIDFDPSAPPPTEWFRFHQTIWPDDPYSSSLLQEWFGYCLTNDTSQQKIMNLSGPTRSGKGTIAKILTLLVGKSNVAGPTVPLLATNFGLQSLIGKPLAIIGDAKFTGAPDEKVSVDVLKTISGEDPISIDRKFLKSWIGTLPTRFMVLSNDALRFKDDSGAGVGRFMILQTRESFLGREDLELLGRLTAELPGILLWAIEGWRRLRQQRRFTVPPAMADVVAEMEAVSSPMRAFVAEACDLGDGFDCTPTDLYNAWCAWCVRSGRKDAGSTQVFPGRLRTSVPMLPPKKQERVKGKQVWLYKGIAPKCDW